ncbi:NADH dehydrogenase (quinone) subunit G [Ktedonosporobacter rubrisoli]|uniref:NADH dehydrogenase (Quinone) subunit G n=1 Tax=Ktedonosporobacter rubrisoli TaxID=2509675 RepID=A0A4V0YZL9_KTERU|nr:NADH-quinone oxidoreductase subunit NuoG [Ktedonosporobacter rubrisoli]QBD80181.1 NADH dehydrogenase (quinone) subunit G [Ktedonosporobacter rubrisoli]
MPEEKKDELVHLTIDGIPVEVPPGTVVWAAAQKAGIEIPIYCYHPKMPPLGACRMCFVEIEKMPKPPQTACTTVVSEGMVVHTKNEMVQKARRGTLEFLLINHPLDCPICDKAGECDLQDFTLRHGPGGTRFDLYKRHFQKPIPVSKDVFLDRERCILCQRCTRFSSEISMDNGLVMISRGFRMEVGTAPDHAFDSVFSGNTVEMCPVGALTASSYRFKARPWELKRVPSVCNNCSVGCNARVDVRVDKIMRLMSRTNDEVDDGWLCNRGRWDFNFVNNPQRLRTPLIKRNGSLTPATWSEALQYIAQRFKDISGKHGAQAIGGIGSTRTTNEETYLFQKFLREVIGTPNVDHHHGRFEGPRDKLTGKPWMLTNSIVDLEKAGHIVLIASDPYQRQPVLNLRIKKAMRGGAKITIINSAPTELDRFETNDQYKVRTIAIPEHGAGAAAHLLLKLALSHKDVDSSKYEGRISTTSAGKAVSQAVTALGESTTTSLQQLVDELVSAGSAAKGAVILYDEMATLDPGCEDLAADLQALAVVTNNIDRPGAGVGPLFEDANSLGARDMGLLPDALPGYQPAAQTGLSYSEMLSSPQLKALYVMGANPVRHLAKPELPSTLEFVVVQDILLTETAQQADVVLPAVTFAEKDGSMTNVDHHVQAIRRALRPLPGAKSDWEILIELAHELGKDWSYDSPQEILDEIAASNSFYAGLTWEDLGMQGVRTQEQEVAHA